MFGAALFVKRLSQNTPSQPPPPALAHLEGEKGRSRKGHGQLRSIVRVVTRRGGRRGLHLHKPVVAERGHSEGGANGRLPDCEAAVMLVIGRGFGFLQGEYPLPIAVVAWTLSGSRAVVAP